MAKKNKKHKHEQTDTSTSASKSVIKPRNTAAINPLLSKGHAHTKPKKAERNKSKQELRKELMNAKQDD